MGSCGLSIAGAAPKGKRMAIILGLESSCDETAAALVRSDRTVLAHALAGQEDHHRVFGGVVPEIAARAHADLMTPLVETALADAGLTLDDVDAIAATAGPGLIGGVMVGLVTAKALAMAAGKPLIAVNHLEGHALSPRLVDAELEFPYLLLLVSGGHCQLLRVNGVGDYDRLATTIDDAVGEAFDKSAKILGLGFPGGPAVERAAKNGDAKAVPLPRPLKGADEPHFSFAGLKSAVLRAHESGQHRAEDIAASFQQAVVDCLQDRLEYSLARIEPLPALVVAGRPEPAA
jgi:N6-L-threonylcarbamoyladenine synthase